MEGGFFMRMYRIRNRLLQLFYRPPHVTRRLPLPSRAWALVDEIDQAIEEKITPLLAGLWEE
jgi:hypothetical protein